MIYVTQVISCLHHQPHRVSSSDQSTQLRGRGSHQRKLNKERACAHTKNGRNREEKSGEEVKMQHKTETLEQNQARHSLFWCQSSSSQGVLGWLTQNGLTADALWFHSRGHKWEVYVWKTEVKWKQAFADSQWKLQATQPLGGQQLIEKLLCFFLKFSKDYRRSNKANGLTAGSSRV